MHRAIRLTGRALLASLLALVVAEIALRVVGYGDDLFPAGPRGLFVADDSLGIRLRPRFRGRHVTDEFDVPIETNSLGMREREIGAPRGVRIVCTGDSFCLGFGVEAEEAYPRRLEEELRTRGIEAEVLNGGCSSYGTVQQVTWLRAMGAQLAPDVVLASLFPGNDLEDNVRGPEAELTERYGYPVSKELAKIVDASFGWRLAGRVRLALFVRMNWLRRLERLQRSAPAATGAPAAALPRPWQAPIWSGIPLMAEDPEGRIEALWAACERSLRDLEGASEDLDAALYLLYVPTRAEASEAAFEQDLTAVDLGEARLDRDGGRGRAAEICERIGVELVDPTPSLADGLSPQPLYFAGNRHWTAAGHARAAAAIADALAPRLR
jgi:lysophospholipase L1-like esterase